MAWSEHEDGSQTMVIDTEHTFGTDPQTVDGTFQLYCDVSTHADGDVTIFRFYEDVRSAGTERSMILGEIADNQTNNLWISVPVINIHGGHFTGEQTDGTGRVVLFSIRLLS